MTPTVPEKDDDFALANRAFNLFTLQERRLALEEFARLRYPRIADRFIEAVHVVIQLSRTAQ